MSKEAGFRATRGVRAGRFSRWPAARIPAPGRTSARTPLHINGNPPWERRLPPRLRSDARPISAPRVPHPTPAPHRVAPRPRTTLRAEGRGRRRGAGRGGRERRAGRGRGSRAIGRGFRCCDWNPSIWRRSAAAARWRTSEYEVKPAAALVTPRARCPPPRCSTCPGP